MTATRSVRAAPSDLAGSDACACCRLARQLGEEEEEAAHASVQEQRDRDTEHVCMARVIWRAQMRALAAGSPGSWERRRRRPRARARGSATATRSTCAWPE